jgi:hypothetical protein
MADDDDDKLNELRDILRGTRSAEVVKLTPRPLAAARNGLPEELRPHFDALVADCHAVSYETGRLYEIPGYDVLAELVRRGWRRL